MKVKFVGIKETHNIHKTGPDQYFFFVWLLSYFQNSNSLIKINRVIKGNNVEKTSTFKLETEKT